MTIGKRIKSLRKQKGLSQTELAELLEIKQSTVANYEKDTRNPNLEMLTHMAIIFDTTTDFIIRGTENGGNIIELGDQLTDLMMRNKLKQVEDIIQKYQLAHGTVSLYLNLLRYTFTKIGWLWEIGYLKITEEHRMTELLMHYVERYKPVNKAKGKIIAGYVVNGDGHTIGMRMLSHLLSETNDSRFLGGSIPLNDLKEYIKTEKIELLIISVSSQTYHHKLLNIIESIDVPIIVVGYGIENFYTYHDHVIGMYKHIEGVLEALNEREEN